MKLYLLRHGIAEERRIGLPDHERHLTEEGVAEMRAVAAGLKRLKLRLDLILTSPFPRARETAEIVAEALEMQERLREEARLAPGCRLGDLQQIVENYPQAERLMIVGHESDFSVMAGQLVGGAAIDLKKGGLIRLETDRIEPGRGLLEWLLTPAILTK